MTGAQERDPFVDAGYGRGDIAIGRCPAVLAVDLQHAFTDRQLALGRSAHVQNAVERAAELLSCARQVGIPVCHTYVAWRADGADLGLWAAKIPSLAEIVPGSGLEEIDRRVLGNGDVVVRKRKPSAFFGTGLDAMLREHGVDTLVVCGVTTSGCVRASVVDAFSYGFRVVVTADASGDQDEAAHDANVADLGRRYANVWTSAEVVARVVRREVEVRL